MSLSKAKLAVSITGNKKLKTFAVDKVFDNRTGKYWTEEQVKERGIETFLDFEDMKASLNWNLNGNGSKFQFRWGPHTRTRNSGVAYIFD